MTPLESWLLVIVVVAVACAAAYHIAALVTK